MYNNDFLNDLDICMYSLNNIFTVTLVSFTCHWNRTRTDRNLANKAVELRANNHAGSLNNIQLIL